MSDLVIVAQSLCVSHTKKGALDPGLRRALRIVSELLHDAKPVNKRLAFVTIMKDCAYGGTPVVEEGEQDKDLIFVNGCFSARELSDRMVWSE